MEDNKEKLQYGLLKENEGNLDAAYELYYEAAQNGSADAMYAIGNLYLYKKYKGKTDIDVFHWKSQLVPDYEKAFEWFMKAAENGQIMAMNNVGVMLYNGAGCTQDTEKAKEWIIKSAKNKNAYGIKAAKDLFNLDLSKPMTDEEYKDIISKLTDAVCEGSADSSRLYEQLITGNDWQIKLLNYFLALSKYNVGGLYLHLPYQPDSHKNICLPISYRRVNWRTLILIDTDVIPEGSIVSFASDAGIIPGIHIIPVSGVRPIGYAKYTANDFGWLNGSRNAALFQVDKSYNLSINIDTVDCCFKDHFEMALKIKDELPSGKAAFIQCGEKEFSTEIGLVDSDDIQIILRYTIDGWDQGEEAADARDLKKYSEMPENIL